MNLGDDLLIAGLGAGFSGAAALLGSWIGARATRTTALDVLNRAAQREDEAWRKALHVECLLNIQLSKDLHASGLWSFDTRVLRDSSSHAAAVDQTLLQRIIWARAANENLRRLSAN